MLSQLVSASLIGVDAIRIEVETNLDSGLPMFVVVGLPDSAIKESRERVLTAIKNSGFVVPPKKITVNLAPADVRKEGTAFDLPMALGILASAGIIDAEQLKNTVVIGELALDGMLRRVSGALPVSVMASREKFDRLIVPRENAREAAVAAAVHQTLNVYGVESLTQAVGFLNGEINIEPESVKLE
ncbi:MAG: magnesium chelatase, partial [Rhizobacter sp.]|nr:magnesium chelatase [Chlorobiales bacterium]